MSELYQIVASKGFGFAIERPHAVVDVIRRACVCWVPCGEASGFSGERGMGGCCLCTRFDILGERRDSGIMQGIQPSYAS